MQRPEYVNTEGGYPSVETWQEACASSQQWADSARLAALKRKRKQHWIGGVMALLFLNFFVLLALFLTGIWTP